MNIWTRIQVIFGAKAQAALDSVEDPRQTLEYSYQRQRDLLRKIKQGLIDVATSHKQLEGQSKKLRARLPQLEDQAKRALAAGREDLARIALLRKQTCLNELAQLETQLQEVAEEERKLTIAEQKFALRVDAFRTKRDTLSARYTAAEAQVRINETITGVSGEFGELGGALERTEEKIDRMQARASAIGALLENGALESPGDDPLERELRDLTSATAVEDELATLKAQLNQSATQESVTVQVTASPEL
ncbi:MAG: PspA/IM30 family protein [Chloroflexi bacterium]|nr:PspA/IM30 family protein [Chloroflexota bacterium]MBI5714463.1 PspA/IM30 family protein [Chloroflexota bacterium]